jgi:hypothetical protein
MEFENGRSMVSGLSRIRATNMAVLIESSNNRTEYGMDDSG